MRQTKKKKEYDTVLKGRAFTGLALRIAVAGYFVYLVWKIATNWLLGRSPMPEWVMWLVCIAFGAAAIGFCAYALKSFLKALKNAERAP